MMQLRQFSRSIKQLVYLGGLVISRLGWLPANMSPLGGFGFFSKYPWIYFLSIIVFDKFVGGFYLGFWWTYLGFAAYPLFGYLSRKQPKIQAVFLPIASFCFFLLSNFGSFWYWYPHTLSGFLLCYTLALPFYVRTLAGDLFFGYGWLAIVHRASILKQIRCALLKVLYPLLPA
ncbi:hypothetical protein KBC89_03695 [Candidatus Woesebacteria bacterium]|nr:hypothetical protein [Candidatus Woesebacteria bacterium]